MIKEAVEAQIYKEVENLNSVLANPLSPETVIDFVDNIMKIINTETTLGRVQEFMYAFKQTVLDVPTLPSDEIVDLRLDLELEETIELAQACGSRALSVFGTLLKKKAEEIRDIVEKGREYIEPNLVEVFDALVDKEYIHKGTISAFGFGKIFDDGFEEVHASNMSKLCINSDEAVETQNHYKAQDVHTIIVPHSNYFLIMREQGKKVLKSINYKPANLKPILDGISDKTDSKYIKGHDPH